MNNKSIAFIDVDDVLLNFQDAFIEALNGEFGKKIPLGSRPSEWDWSCWLTKEEMAVIKNPLDWFHKVRPVWNETQLAMHPRITREFLEALRENGVKVVLLTSIPLEFALGRIKNLHSQSLPYDEIYFTDGYNKSGWINSLCDRYSAQDKHSPEKLLFLDDRGKNCVDVAVNCPFLDSKFTPRMRVISLDTPYNQKEIALIAHTGLKIAWCEDVIEMYEKSMSYILEVVC